jgi:hypothetical protein
MLWGQNCPTHHQQNPCVQQARRKKSKVAGKTALQTCLFIQGNKEKAVALRWRLHAHTKKKLI